MDKMLEYGIIAGVIFLIWIFYMLTRKRVEANVRQMEDYYA